LPNMKTATEKGGFLFLGLLVKKEVSDLLK
jgi:hypothetical protein